MDSVDKHTRSNIMRSVPRKNTTPEIVVRKHLFNRGFRYRLHNKKLPGSPDLVLKKYKAVIFIHGCFWHRHGCKYTTSPKTRTEFWNNKFEANIKRDNYNIDELHNIGWRVCIIWECRLKTKNNEDIEQIFKTLTKWLDSDKKFLEI